MDERKEGSDVKTPEPSDGDGPFEPDTDTPADAPGSKPAGSTRDTPAGVADDTPGDTQEVLETVDQAFERELADANRRADENWDRYLRAEADLDNHRRAAEQWRQRRRWGCRRRRLCRLAERVSTTVGTRVFAGAGTGWFRLGPNGVCRRLETIPGPQDKEIDRYASSLPAIRR